MAAEEGKARRKPAEDEGVFFRFGDDPAVDDNPHRAIGILRKIGDGVYIAIKEGFRKEVANGLVDSLLFLFWLDAFAVRKLKTKQSFRKNGKRTGK